MSSYDYSETRSFYVAMVGTHHVDHTGLFPPQLHKCWLELVMDHHVSPKSLFLLVLATGTSFANAGEVLYHFIYIFY